MHGPSLQEQPTEDAASVIRVVLCSPIRLYRDGLAATLGARPGIVILDESSDAAGLLRAMVSRAPDVVLLDMATPDGIGLVGDLRAEWPAVSVVVLAVPEDECTVIACAEAGVAGYVTRDESLDDLFATLIAVAHGETVCTPRTTAILLRHVAELASRQPQATDAVHLTPRETEVLRLLAEGLSNKQIGRRLYIELPTVKNHVHNILEKLSVQRRGEAVAWARTQRALRV